SFYSQGSDEQRNASSEVFFEQALEYFGHSGPPLTDSYEKGRTLARLVGEQRGLLVLDGLEPLQHPPAFDQGRLKDPAVQSLLLALAAGWVGEAPPRGLCLVTSRQPVAELANKTGRLVIQHPLEKLDPEAGAELLRQLEVAGPDKELRQASEELRGHAYTLMLLGTYLRDATPDHEIRRRKEIPLLEEDAEHGRHARHLFAAYVRHLGDSSPEVAVLRLLGFFDRPAEEKLLAALRAADEPALAPLTMPLRDLSETSQRRVLHRLRDLRLIDIPAGPSPPIDAHPLLRECFAEQMRTEFPAAWQAGHQRLFEFLCDTTEHRPDTLPGLQPLYQAVAHGCLAGLYQQACDKVYIDRILRGMGLDGFYSIYQLGAIGADLGAMACFFTVPWTTLAPSLTPDAQAWLLNEAAFLLRALGRLPEAVEPLRVSMEMDIEREDWNNAAVVASHLGELELTRGEVAAAVTAGEQAVTYADRSSEASQQMICRAVQANVLHQAGRRAEARDLFEDAETRQAARQPEYPRLLAGAGFRYCELLLGEAERVAWQRWLSGRTGARDTFAVPVAACEAVSERAKYALNIARENRWLLDIALDDLTLARATLCKADFAHPIPPPAHQHITAAVDGLRTAGHINYLPGGLLTRAWLRCVSKDEASARADLEEAWEIAERGPMPLFQADVLLTRARLFRDRAALAEARRLIEKHGYGRRLEELADAEEAAAGWDLTPRPPLPSPSLPPGEGAPPPGEKEESVRDQVFISYSHLDKKLHEELLLHLAPYVRSGSVTAWSDKQIAPGSTWFTEIQDALKKARVAVLLVSPGFLASGFINDHELGPLLKEAKAGGVRILWVPLRASSYEETGLKDLQAVSPPDEPLAQMSKASRDAAWVRVCKEIKQAVSP
ncbi:MAG TPA: TIR domain-containing protein, partial [Thermoanaerobaculia bacterium]|nr:TIR domain-containing protein [Thermoanaerobaculia bacterium]